MSDYRSITGKCTNCGTPISYIPAISPALCWKCKDAKKEFDAEVQQENDAETRAGL